MSLFGVRRTARDGAPVVLVRHKAEPKTKKKKTNQNTTNISPEPYLILFKIKENWRLFAVFKILSDISRVEDEANSVHVQRF